MSPIKVANSRDGAEMKQAEGLKLGKNEVEHHSDCIDENPEENLKFKSPNREDKDDERRAISPVGSAS